MSGASLFSDILPERAPLARSLTIGEVTIPNRIAMAPMTRGYSPRGVPTQETARYYARRARGGAGLIITEGVGVEHPSAVGDAGFGEDHIPVMYGAPALEGWREVVKAVHAEGAVIVPQLWHQGVMRIAGTGPFPEAPAIGPSGLWGPLGSHSMDIAKLPSDPRLGAPMTGGEIQAVIDAFVSSARDAMSIGFDGIALHGGHGYLLDNFLWAGTNLRADRWGGDRRRRTEIVIEIVRGIRRAIGTGKPILFRFSQWRLQDYKSALARSPDELEEIVAPIADAGVDVFDPSVRYFDTPAFPGSELNLSGWTKKLTGKLALAVGGIGIDRGAFAEGASTAAVDNIDKVMARFNRGEFDMIAVGRAMIGDPQWPRKALRGEAPDVYEPSQLNYLI